MHSKCVKKLFTMSLRVDTSRLVGYFKACPWSSLARQIDPCTCLNLIMS